MENTVYKNHKKEINELISHIIDGKYQIILSNSQSGYGNTSFLSRCQYILHNTKKLQLFGAELSNNERNPIHCITKNIASKKGKLYQQMQLFTDEELGIANIPLSVSIVKDLTQSDTLASFFDQKSAVPIYTGFYQDRLKEIFFELINKIALEKRVIIFIDNVQLIDNESIYELRALLKNPQITLVLSKSGEGEYFDKFYFETKYLFSEIEIPFPEPNIEYVKELGSIYNKNLSSSDADLLLNKSHKNIRKLLYYLREPNMNTTLDDLQQQIAKILYMYGDYICARDLLKICSYSPYKGIINLSVIENTFQKLEELNLLTSIIKLNDREKNYKLLNEYSPYIDIADKLVINKSLLMFFYYEKNLAYGHLNHAWQIASTLKEKTILEHFSIELVKTALEFGFKIDNNVIAVIKDNQNYEVQVMVAALLFCNANYKEAKKILAKYADDTSIRSIKVIYAITLNRCREHMLAEEKLTELIQTSSDIDELTILVTFLISNHVHNNKISEAKGIFHTYNPKLSNSKKYAYFLRNAATIFEPSKAYGLRNTAKNLFNAAKDMFGYYTTIINMTSYLVNNTLPEYAIGQVLMAFEGLLPFNASQIHLAANNLGICYFLNDNYVQAIKYFHLCGCEWLRAAIKK